MASVKRSSIGSVRLEPYQASTMKRMSATDEPASATTHAVRRHPPWAATMMSPESPRQVGGMLFSTAPLNKVTIARVRHSRKFLAGIQQKILDARLRGHDSRLSDTHSCGPVLRDGETWREGDAVDVKCDSDWLCAGRCLFVRSPFLPITVSPCPPVLLFVDQLNSIDE